MARANIQQARIAGGIDCGKLKIVVEVRLDSWEEQKIANALGCGDAARENLERPPLKRCVGPVGRLADRMLAIVEDLKAGGHDGE